MIRDLSMLPGIFIRGIEQAVSTYKCTARQEVRLDYKQSENLREKNGLVPVTRTLKNYDAANYFRIKISHGQKFIFIRY